MKGNVYLERIGSTTCNWLDNNQDGQGIYIYKMEVKICIQKWTMV